MKLRFAVLSVGAAAAVVLAAAGSATAATGAGDAITPAPLSAQAAAAAPSEATASAAPAATVTVRLPAGATVAHIRLGASQATVVRSGTVAPLSVITCTLAIQYPHKSTHVPENVNVVGTITCSAPVSELAIDVGLYFNNVLVAQGSNNNFGSAFLQGNAAKLCVNGSYRGGDTGAVLFPPGYEPPSSNFGGQEVFSPAVLVKC
ncbi:MAG TPA: hypothetical protein VKU39_00545 [Streptosporangiaceae bacterium]|nr:hypothetical protein [Streptosporangiaceae bacterium]